jgi:mannose-1-phosphate guanylyltransferase
VEPERIVTVIGCGHQRFIREGSVIGRIIEQPSSRDTGVGVFLPATYVYADAPDTTVIILPSDHFVFPEIRFTNRIREACELSESFPEKLILAGAQATYAETDYGWIAPGLSLDSSICESRAARDVAGFQEKPSLSIAQQYLESGYLWNTMIVVARLKTLWSIGRRLQPECIERFSLLLQIWKGSEYRNLSAEAERELLNRLYLDMPAFNFSRDLLASCADQCLVLPLEGVEWSDLGRVERVAAVLEHSGLHSNIPSHLLQDARAI